MQSQRDLVKSCGMVATVGTRERGASLRISDLGPRRNKEHVSIASDMRQTGVGQMNMTHRCVKAVSSSDYS